MGTIEEALLANVCTISAEERSALDARAQAVFSHLILERPRANSISEFFPYHFPHAPIGKPTISVSAALVRS